MKALESMMISINLVHIGLGRKSSLKIRINGKEKDDKKQKNSDGPQQSINKAWTYYERYWGQLHQALPNSGRENIGCSR